MKKIKIQAVGSHNEDALRLHEILLHLNLTGKEFSIQIGYLRPDQIYRVLKGHYPISRKMAEAISRRYPEIDVHWIQTGRGAMLKAEAAELVFSPPDPLNFYLFFYFYFYFYFYFPYEGPYGDPIWECHMGCHMGCH